MIRVNGSKKSCVYTLCATRPCHRGTCVAQSPSKFTCHCPEGYRGRHCETPLAIYREDVGLSFSSLFAICICFMALLGSYCIYCILHKQERGDKIKDGTAGELFMCVCVEFVIVSCFCPWRKTLKRHSATAELNQNQKLPHHWILKANSAVSQHEVYSPYFIHCNYFHQHMAIGETQIQVKTAYRDK